MNNNAKFNERGQNRITMEKSDVEIEILIIMFEFVH